MIIFIDLETTGLSPRTHRTLEVAAIATDDTFTEIGRFTAIAHWAHSSQLIDFHPNAARDQVAKYLHVDPYVLEMHTKNGLWRASADSRLSLGNVDDLLVAFIEESCVVAGIDPGEKTGPQLAGNTISFDRAFMKEDLRKSHALLHYRNVDITTLNEMARRFWPAVHGARPRTAPDGLHRAEADVLESLETARYYSRVLIAVPAAIVA